MDDDCMGVPLFQETSKIWLTILNGYREIYSGDSTKTLNTPATTVVERIIMEPHGDMTTSNRYQHNYKVVLQFAI